MKEEESDRKHTNKKLEDLENEKKSGDG